MQLRYFLVIIILLIPASQAEEWESYESEHFIFYYLPQHLTTHEISRIACNQEALFIQITDILHIEFHDKITYYLYGTREDYGSIPGAYAIGTQIKFLCIFCEDMCKNGLNDAHEMTHALSTKIGQQHGLLSEGLAVYIEDYRIRGENLHPIIKILHHQGRLTPLSDLIQDFWCDISYNYDIAGSFTTFLIETYGMDRFKELYAKELAWGSFIAIYGKPLEILESEWIAVLNEVEVTPQDFDTIRYRDLIQEGLGIYFDLGFLRVQHGTYPAHAEEGICLFRSHYSQNPEEAFSYLQQFHEGMLAWKRAIERYEAALAEQSYLQKAELFREAAQFYALAGDRTMQMSSEEQAVLFETLDNITKQVQQKDTSSIEATLMTLEPLFQKYDMVEDMVTIRQEIRDMSQQNYQGFEVGIILIFFCVILGKYVRRISS
ncbi:MAG: hypothetical protein HXS47_10645 [Theionarchaea archaeon]|nr:hypothetical protein [Theionarchaea archaeon]